MNEKLSSDDVVLTGIKPTGGDGGVHVGNYLGAMKPTIEVARSPELETPPLFLIADLHALNQHSKPENLSMGARQIAAAWLACGVADLENAIMYRQSDIPQVAELAVILSNVTPKSSMDRAHAYKAARTRNEAEGKERDSGVNMGLYTYPILMAADIVAVRATIVPVGRDQGQHVEIARDIASRFNREYGPGVLVLPKYLIEDSTGYIPGTDGRKMSKSYGNQIPLFATTKEWEQIVRKIPTDSSSLQAPGIGTYEDAVAFQIYSSLVPPEKSKAVLEELRNGHIGWKGLKDSLLEVLEMRFGSMRGKYNEYLETPRQIMDVLEAGREKVQPIVDDTLWRVKKATGLV